MLHIRDTLTGVKEPFETIEPGRVRMYVCGPTVYASAHIGHAMSYIFFDVVRRYLEYKGCQVHHVQNFTDVDDKIIERALAEGGPWDELAVEFAEEFLSDIERLNVLPANAYPRASASVGAIIEDVARLIELGKAYTAGGDVYFRVLSIPSTASSAGAGSTRCARAFASSRWTRRSTRWTSHSGRPRAGRALVGQPVVRAGRAGIECTTMVLRELGSK
ncbi:MAG: class I tRNA ligase family protein [Chloroflexia bacterium]